MKKKKKLKNNADGDSPCNNCNKTISCENCINYYL